MNAEHFRLQMDRLRDQFGANQYKRDRMELIWAEVEGLPDSWFTRLIDQFIGDCRQAPILPDFRSAVAEERERTFQKVSPEGMNWNEFAQCTYCYDNGVYLCTHKSEQGFWAFRCHCIRGQRDPRKNIPQFKQGHMLDYVYFDLRALKKPQLKLVQNETQTN